MHDVHFAECLEAAAAIYSPESAFGERLDATDSAANPLAHHIRFNCVEAAVSGSTLLLHVCSRSMENEAKRRRPE